MDWNQLYIHPSDDTTDDDIRDFVERHGYINFGSGAFVSSHSDYSGNPLHEAVGDTINRCHVERLHVRTCLKEGVLYGPLA